MARQQYDYDLVIVGGGSAGIVAGNVAGALGARVALVEKERIGGECLWTGCVPSKALLYAASAAWTIRQAKEFGFKNVRAPGRQSCAGAFDYVRRKIEEVRVNDATEQMLRDFGVDLYFGGGTFIAPHLLRTPERDLRGAQFLVATGSSPLVPSLEGLEQTGYLTNTTLFDLEAVPESVVIIGGGYIAVEMGQALNRLGARVCILQRGERLLREDEPELVDLLTALLRQEGIEIVTGAEAVAASFAGEKVVSAKMGEGDVRSFPAAEILVAAGRRPNSTGLGLETVGVFRKKHGFIAVDETGRTSQSYIWACGDVTGRAPFSHMAEHEAKLVVRNMLIPGAQKVPLDLLPRATFTEPELARVGKSEQEAIQALGEGEVRVLRHEFRQDDRALVENQGHGLVKVIVNKSSGEILGATILGPRAGELINEWTLAIRHHIPVKAIADLIHVYPSLSVCSQRAAQKWYVGMTEQPLVKGALGLLGYEPREANLS